MVSQMAKNAGERNKSPNKLRTHNGQESAIGKALWHQVTTVVIL